MSTTRRQLMIAGLLAPLSSYQKIRYTSRTSMIHRLSMLRSKSKSIHPRTLREGFMR